MDRFTWGIVVGVLLLVGAGVGTAVLVGSRETPPDLSTPSGVAVAFELAVDRGDADTAWPLLANSAQNTTTLERFRQSVQARNDRSRRSVISETVDGETARVVVGRSYGSSSGLFFSRSAYVNEQTVRLERERGQWRVTTPSLPYLINTVR